MQLNPLSSSQVRLEGTQPSGPRQVRSTTSDSAQFSAAEGVDQALEAEPDVRSHEVARATKLIASVQYPPDELINGISHLIAEGL
jgi:hypothetical protein